jgi:hypothetical protein
MKPRLVDAAQDRLATAATSPQTALVLSNVGMHATGVDAANLDTYPGYVFLKMLYEKKRSRHLLPPVILFRSATTDTEKTRGESIRRGAFAQTSSPLELLQLIAYALGGGR